MVQLCLHILFLYSSYSHSFEFLGSLVGNPDVKTKIDYDSSFGSSGHSDFTGTKVDQSRTQLSLNVPLFQEGPEAWGVSTDVQSLRLSGYNFESDNRIEMKNNFEGYAFGGFYRKKMEKRRTLALFANYASMSDKPFANANDNNFNMFAVFKIQQTPVKDLVLFLAYSSHRTILSGIPLPGFAMVYNPRPELFAVYGLPMSYILYIPIDNLIVTATAVLPVTFKADINYRFWGPLIVFGGWEMDHRYFFVSDRTVKEDKVYFDEKGFSTGLKVLFSRTSYITLAANYDYYNTLFASEGYYSHRDWAIDIDPHWSFDFKATFSF